MELIGGILILFILIACIKHEGEESGPWDDNKEYDYGVYDFNDYEEGK
jgi:hypothetical protein